MALPGMGTYTQSAPDIAYTKPEDRDAPLVTFIVDNESGEAESASLFFQEMSGLLANIIAGAIKSGSIR